MRWRRVCQHLQFLFSFTVHCSARLDHSELNCEVILCSVISLLLRCTSDCHNSENRQENLVRNDLRFHLISTLISCLVDNKKRRNFPPTHFLVPQSSTATAAGLFGWWSCKRPRTRRLCNRENVACDVLKRNVRRVTEKTCRFFMFLCLSQHFLLVLHHVYLRIATETTTSLHRFPFWVKSRICEKCANYLHSNLKSIFGKS